MILPPRNKRRESASLDLEQPFAHSVSQAEARGNLCELIRREVELARNVFNVDVIEAVQYVKCFPYIGLNGQTQALELFHQLVDDQ